jgi:hypothetical protein
MNPDPRPPSWFGRTVAQAARGSFILSLLGCGVMAAVDRYLNRPNTPLGELYRTTGIPAHLPLLLGMACVIAIAVGAAWTSVRVAPRFRITDDGFDVESALGRYRFDWENVVELGVTRSRALGLRIEDRDALLVTHEGSPKQREWLRTMEPYGEWDFIFHRSELGYPSALVLEWIREVCGEDEGNG